MLNRRLLVSVPCLLRLCPKKRGRRFLHTSSSRQSIRAEDVLSYWDKIQRNPRRLTNLRQFEQEYRTLTVKLNEINDLDKLLQESEDAELRSAAEEELSLTRRETDRLALALASALVPLPLFHHHDASLEVRAGAGGLEAGMFAQEIFDFYTSYAQSLGFDVTVTKYLEQTAVGSKAATGRFASTTGIQEAEALRVPVTGTKNDRLQTSTCSLAVVPVATEADVPIEDKDLKFEYMRSTGAGGQNVNKLDTACRVTHLPTKLTAHCEEERSQLRNRDKAVKKLKAELFRIRYEEETTRANRERKSQIGNMDRNEKIRTYNYSRNSITDHRLMTSRQVPSLTNFFNCSLGFGVIDEFQGKLSRQAELERLQEELSRGPS